LGRIISDYALRCLDLKEYAILAPNTEYGLDLAQAFESNITAQGGSVIASEYYDPDAKDYAGHFKVIRHLKAKAILENKWITRGKDPNTVPKKILKSWAGDSVMTIQALFIAAANGDEAFRLSSQARYHKLKTRVLGSSGWCDKELIHKGTRNTRGTVFSVNFLIDEKDKKWKSFSKKYFERWQSYPDKVSVLGYDATQFVIRGLKKGDWKRLKRNLGRIKAFTGIQGEINLDPYEGYNLSASMAKIGKRDFVKVEFCKDP
jgi:ABC-type branched-subunit amino acid transport system substrate-binding protein